MPVSPQPCDVQYTNTLAIRTGSSTHVALLWDFKPKSSMFKETSHFLGVHVLQRYSHFYDSLVKLLKKRERFMTEMVIKL